MAECLRKVRNVDIDTAREKLRKAIEGRGTKEMLYDELPLATRTAVERVVKADSIDRRAGGVETLWRLINGQYNAIHP